MCDAHDPKLWHVCCDRDGLIVVEESVPPGLVELATGSAVQVALLMPALARHAPERGGWVIPGVAEAGADSGAALDAALALVERWRLATTGTGAGPDGPIRNDGGLMGPPAPAKR